ncbi:MAG: hypothetical protein ACRBN8_17575, partial [Nannocystales bacterium]
LRRGLTAQLSSYASFRSGRPYHAYTSAWGDIGAATSILNCIAAIHAWDRGYAKGPAAMVWGGSESGARAALVLSER